MEDYHQIDSMMDGQPYKAGCHAASLRRHLWREHLGLLPAQDIDASKDPNAQPPGDCPNHILEGEEDNFVADPLGDKLWDMWTSRASTNTDIFRHLFRADPDNNSKFPTPAFWPKQYYVFVLVVFVLGKLLSSSQRYALKVYRPLYPVTIFDGDIF